MSERSGKRVHRTHTDEFRRNAISMVEDQDYTVTQAARELGINQNLLRTWRKKYGKSAAVSEISESEQNELDRLRKEIRQLRMERAILKNATAFLRTKRTEISVHRTAPRRMADHIDVRGPAGQPQRLLRLEETSDKRSFTASGGSGL
jgi:transposase